MRRSWLGTAEAVAFTGAILVYIWSLRAWFPPAFWLLVFWMLLSFALRGETLASLGFCASTFWRTLSEWRYAWAAGMIALLAVGIRSEHLARGAVYFLFCILQQTVLQNMIYKRFRRPDGGRWPAQASAGALFGLVHWPNLLLVPATFAWGAASSRLFERWPSVPGLALAQVILSSLFYEIVPGGWHRGLRVGPGFWGPTP